MASRLMAASGGGLDKAFLESARRYLRINENRTKLIRKMAC